MELVKLTIDNRPIEVEKGTTVYLAAKKLGIEIPTLCYMYLSDLNIEHNPAVAGFVWWKWKEGAI